MNSIMKSASKLVFILMALTACAGFFVGKLEQDQFMILAVAIFGFYTARKGESNHPFEGK